jgi:dipeptidyl aminopeptidase/acylaminoacyl peptidase
VSSPQVSPDGSRIAFVRKHVGEKNEYVTNLWMVATDGQSPPRPFTAGGKDSQPRWSPDGSRIAFIGAREKDKPQVWVIPAAGGGALETAGRAPAGGEAVPLTRFPEGSFGRIQWSPDGRWIAASFREQHANWTAEAKKKREETGASTPPREIDDWWYRLDGDGYFLGQRHHLYLIDASSGEARMVYSKDVMGTFNFDFSPDSRQIVIATNRDRRAMIRPWKSELLRLNIAPGARFGTISRIPNLPEGVIDRVAWSPDGRWIAYVGREGRDGAYSTKNLHLYVCDPVKGGARDLLRGCDDCLLAVAISDAAEAEFAASIQWAPARASRRLYFRLGRLGETHIGSVSLRGGDLRLHTRGRIACDMGNLSADGRIMALTTAAPTRLAEVFAADTQAAPFRLRRLSTFNDALLGELDLIEPQEAWVKAPDGTQVHTWCLKPRTHRGRRGARRQRFPAVLEVHGGPHAMYGVGFFHEFQLLAANGYAVFYSNPRGSKGYGEAFCDAIRGSWGDRDWVDVQAVTRFMQKQPFVAPKRIGIMGGSYGGFMTNWAIGHSREYCAAITDRCVSNLISMFGSSDYTEAPDAYWPGNAWDRPEHMWTHSPLKYLGQARTPMLIIHSEGDLRCNVEQAEQVFTALKLRNVPCRFVRYPASTFHGMSRSGPPDLRMHRLREILNWWRRWL